MDSLLGQYDMTDKDQAAAEAYAEQQFAYWKKRSIELSNPTLHPVSTAEAFLAGVAHARAENAAEVKLVWPSFLDSREFYELMQTYRHTPAEKFVEVQEAYDAVRFFIRDKWLARRAKEGGG